MSTDVSPANEALNFSTAAPAVLPPRSRHGNVMPDALEAPATDATETTTDESWNSSTPWKNGLDWGVVIWMLSVHFLALGAPFFFTWKALGLALGLSWLCGGIGICLCFHRLLTHGSFQTYKPVRWLLTLLGTFSGEGSAITWVANHRKHHAHSDKPGDPHSPHDGPWWSHMLWFTPYFGQTWHHELTTKYCPDLLKDPVQRFFHKTFLLWQIPAC